jgi:DNA-binding NarL/FixJ family response regulator
LAAVANSENKIRLLVADSAVMSCHLLADALQRASYQAVPATASKQVLRLLEKSPFDVLLIGAGNSDDSFVGTRFLRQVRGLYPELNIVVLLENPDRRAIVEAFRAGARGIFSRSGSFESLCKCIRCVYRGQVWANSGELQCAIDALVEHASGAPIATGSRPLSRREEQITNLVAEGYSNRQISERLDLSEHTIKNYLFRVFEKLGVSTRVGLTLYALNQSQSAVPKVSPFTRSPFSLPTLVPHKDTDLPS